MPYRFLSKPVVWMACFVALGLSENAAQEQRDARHWPRSAPVKEGRIVAAGEHFEVHLQFENKLASERALDAVDAAWSHAMEFLGTENHRFASLLEIHLYDSKEQYLEVDKWLTGGNFQFNESFSHWNSLSAHVVMAPPLQPEASKRFGLTSQTLEVLAHEAAHLATYTVVSTYRYHPTWFSEGLAMHVEQATMRGLGLLEDPAEHPRYASQQLVAKRLLDQARVPAVGNLLVDKLDGLSFHERYALWSDFMKVLTRDGERFAAMVRDLRNMRGGPSMRARFSQMVIERYGASFLERELKRELGRLEAHWDESARSLETIGDEWEQVAFGSVDARAWRRSDRPSGAYVIGGALEFLGQTSTLQVLLGHRDSKYLSVDFQRERIGLVAHGEGGSQVLVDVELPPLAVGSERPFSVAVGPSELRVEVAGKQLLQLELPERELLGAWGLGVARGGAGVWHRIQVAENR